jgi:transcriptional regulator with XRE-family HTH domain
LTLQRNSGILFLETRREIAMNFGAQIRELRKEQDISLRDFADRVGMDFTYLSKIENSKVEPPSEEKIRSMAKELSIDPEQLLSLAGKVSSEQIRSAVASNPSVGILLRKIQSRNLSSDQIARMVDIATGKEAPTGEKEE